MVQSFAGGFRADGLPAASPEEAREAWLGARRASPAPPKVLLAPAASGPLPPAQEEPLPPLPLYTPGSGCATLPPEDEVLGSPGPQLATRAPDSDSPPQSPQGDWRTAEGVRALLGSLPATARRAQLLARSGPGGATALAVALSEGTPDAVAALLAEGAAESVFQKLGSKGLAATLTPELLARAGDAAVDALDAAVEAMVLDAAKTAAAAAAAAASVAAAAVRVTAGGGAKSAPAAAPVPAADPFQAGDLVAKDASTECITVGLCSGATGGGGTAGGGGATGGGAPSTDVQVLELAPKTGARWVLWAPTESTYADGTAPGPLSSRPAPLHLGAAVGSGLTPAALSQRAVPLRAAHFSANGGVDANANSFGAKMEAACLSALSGPLTPQLWNSISMYATNYSSSSSSFAFRVHVRDALAASGADFDSLEVSFRAPRSPVPIH